MAQGKGLLKVCGILMIIGGGINILLSIIAIIGIIGALALIAMGAQINILGLVALIIAIVGGVMELVCGISGVKNCDKPEKADSCLRFCIIVLACSLLSQLLNLIAGNGFNIVSMLLGCILPVLFIIGAIKNKQSV